MRNQMSQKLSNNLLKNGGLVHRIDAPEKVMVPDIKRKSFEEIAVVL